ncbi:MAG: hypothetical protein HQ498_05930 [Pseudohongiella sp.]|nr:hypothetical protein [Pseudohongiella sp.]
MTMFIFMGDMLVKAFMVGVGIWFCNRGNDEQIAQISRIPLEDEEHHG